VNTPTTWAVDATHASVPNVPTDTPVVIGYSSGTPNIIWTAADVARFNRPNQLITNYQGFGPIPALMAIQEIDVESEAVTPEQAALLVQQRVNAGYQWTSIYGSDAAIEATGAAIRNLGEAIWNGHVLCRLADWTLSDGEAQAKIGHYIHGITCMGVQFASPTSNPDTMLPGSSLTLAQANVDLSIVSAGYPVLLAQKMRPPAPPQPPAPPLLTLAATLVMLPSGTAKIVHSTDNGHTWS
jgi:hypothetical protein